LTDLGNTKITLPYERGTIEVRVPKFKGYYSYDSNIKDDLFNKFYRSCNPFATGTGKEEKISENGVNMLQLSALNHSDCFDFNLPNFSQRVGYLVTVKSRNLEGESLLLSIINNSAQKPDFESNLPKDKNFSTSYFVIPPMEQYGLGYDLYFDNVSLGNVKSVNDLSQVQTNQIPYKFLTDLKIETNTAPSLSANTIDFNVSHPNPSLYGIRLNNITNLNTTLILSQSFDSGWKAYAVDKLGLLNEIFPFLFGKEIKQHILVNNWENGWTIEPDTQMMVIVYLPQYLEYLGFIMLITPILIMLLRFLASKKPKKQPLRVDL
jgi:hypothetical protein